MSKSQAIVLTKRNVVGVSLWVAKPRRTMSWGGKYSGSDERELKDIEGNDISKTQAIWNLRSILDRKLREAKKQKQDLEWKIRMLEELSEETGEKCMNIYKFKNQYKKNKIKTKRTTV